MNQITTPFHLCFTKLWPLDDQPWNKGHEPLSPTKKKNSLFLQKTSDYLGIHPDCSFWLVPFSLSCYICLWSASFLRSRDFVNIYVPPAFLLSIFFINWVQIWGNFLSDYFCSIASFLGICDCYDNLIELIVHLVSIPWTQKNLHLSFCLAFNFWMEQNSVTNSSNAGENLRKDDIRQMIERQDINEEAQEHFGFLWQILTFSILDSKQLLSLFCNCEGWCHVILVWSQTKLILYIRIYQWCRI